MKNLDFLRNPININNLQGVHGVPTFLTIIAEYGMVSAVVIACVTIMFIMLRSRLGTNTASPPPQVASTPDTSHGDLKNHDFFKNIEFKINIDLPMEKFTSDANRNAMYQDLMGHLYSTYHRNMLLFANSVSIGMQAADWNPKLNKTHYTIIQEFTEECMRNSIPEPAIQLFMSWYTPYITRIYHYISSIDRIPDVSIMAKTRMFLLLLELILATLTADAQHAPKLNGELDGLEYKGLTL